MTKLTIVSVLAGVAMLATPFAAMAATISNPLFSNGQTAIDATGGSTVSGTFTLTVGSGEVVEWLRTQSDPSQPFVDTSVGGTLGYQEQTYVGVPFSVKVPPNTGTYYPTVQGAGTFGGARSINGADNVTLGSSGLGTVRVVANGSTDTGGVPSGIPADVWAKFLLWMSGSSSTPTPTVSAVCAAYAQANNGTQSNVYSDANVRLQGFLLSQGASIPALKAGAAFGFYGNQTTAAVGWFNSTNHCN